MVADTQQSSAHAAHFTSAVYSGGTLAADPETYGVRVVCLECGHDCHVTPLPDRGGHRVGQELPDDDDSPAFRLGGALPCRGRLHRVPDEPVPVR